MPDASVSSRWISVDPLAEKHYNLTPYNFVENNPMNMIDPDGQDGIKIIDTQNKTITIRAVYYVQTVQTGNFKNTSYSSKDVLKMNETLNETLNKKGYTVSEGDYAGFNVKFEFDFREGGEGHLIESKATDTYEGIPIANSFTKKDEKLVPRFKEKQIDNGDGTISTQTVGGVTQNHKNITMNANKDTKRNKIHEIFHTLFFDNDDAKKGIGSYQRLDMPNQEDINMLINNQQLPSFELKKEDKK